MNKSQNETILSRREFFKKATKKVLPILSVVALSSMPIISHATKAQITDCEKNCSGGCDNKCTGCGSRCSTDCGGGCKETCDKTCREDCENSCKATSAPEFRCPK